MSLTPHQIQLIKATAPVLKDHGTTITTHFYASLLASTPSLQNIFNTTHQKTGHQASALATALYAYATHIDNLGVLSPAVEKICHKHASMYVQAEHYDVVGKYLLQAMGEVLGDAMTGEILEAWGKAYWQLANIMISQEKQLYASASPWTSWRPFLLTKKIQESEEITSFYFSPVDGKPLPSYLPGQYISLATSIPSLHHEQNRQYSLSDAPSRDYYRISVKKEPCVQGKNGIGEGKGEVLHPAYMSNLLHDEKKEGDILHLSHAYGNFFVDPRDEDSGPLVLISAGVGITPMISILNTFAQSPATASMQKRKISFLHTARSSASLAFGPHVNLLTSTHPNITAKLFLKNPGAAAVQGRDFDFACRMDLDVVDKEGDLFLGDGDARYFVCGPGGFMREVGERLMEYGVDEQRIQLEIFGTANLK